jgi:predicted ATP-dependent endonuclease of OLD family
MDIKKIVIENFKSIEKIEIPLLSYGLGQNSSKSAFFVGINESGKTNILEAINIINTGFDSYDFQTIFCKLCDKNDNPVVDIYYYLDLSNVKFYFDELKKKITIPEELLSKLKVEELKLNIWLDESSNDKNFNVSIADNIQWFQYSVNQKTETTKTAQNTQVTKDIITIKKIQTEDLSKKITKENAGEFLQEGDKVLTKTMLETIFINQNKSTLTYNLPKVVYWSAKPEYLINDNISLEEFKAKPAISQPLKNIFHIFGLNTDSDISKAIDTALKNEEYKSELEDGLTKVATEHVNKIWKEHKIKFKIKFDGNICKVHVEDKVTEHKYYKMNHRSDGFKQFVSLILSLSAQNNSDKLKNHIILIDEPEVHLHPSGIRYMRDELLKIGKNNYVFVATHSHYLIDTKTKERHWIVEKSKKTNISQLSETANFNDDEVISKAFGFDLMKELIPQNILLVEGYGDKLIYNHVLSLIEKTIHYSIKSSGGCSKVYSIASLMSDEEIFSIIVVDDDDEGIKAKADILKSLKSFYNLNSVFTIRDILGTLPQGATLEDLFPLDFVKDFFDKEFSKIFSINEELPIIQQIKRQEKSIEGSNNKERLEKLKGKLSDSFIEKFKNKKDIENKAPKLYNFSMNLIKKMK